jgi:hypothetical protein
VRSSSSRFSGITIANLTFMDRRPHGVNPTWIATERTALAMV